MHSVTVTPAMPRRSQSSDTDELSYGPFDASIASDGFVFDPIRRWATETPDKSALISTEGSVSYRDLEIRTSQIALRLIESGVRHGDLVGLLLPRGADTILIMVAILKAGAAYVPLDPDTPAERIRQCLEDASPSLVIGLTGPDLELPCQFLSSESLLVGSLRPQVSAPTVETPPICGSDTAYVIFTSGTTGRPKGVPILHRSLTNFVRGNQEACIRVTSSDRVFQGFSPASDGHHEEIWPTFQAGATLVVATTDDIHSGDKLGSFLDRFKVTIISCAPTLLSMVDSDVPSIRRVLFGAERCPAELVRRWWTPHREVINTYGPTEATVGVTYAHCRPGQPVTIGRPLPNYFCCVLNDRLEMVARGQEGELCVAGVGVSRGYLGGGASAKFVRNPFTRAGRMDDLLYRTGDLVRVLDCGEIEWLGRIDSQVKIRGYRIELSDIENHILQEQSVRSALVMVRESDQSAASLVALMTPRSGLSIDIASCVARLRSELPAHMVPNLFEEVDSLPVLPSGKMDRRAAGRLHGTPLKLEKVLIAPRTATERLVYGIWSGLFAGANISCSDDFFADLGGYSLLAAQFVSKLRNSHGFAKVSVLDLYENSTLSGIADFLDELNSDSTQSDTSSPAFAETSNSRYAIASVIQGIGVLMLFGIKACFWLSPLLIGAYCAHHGFPALACFAVGIGVHALMVPGAFLLAAAIKWIVIGRFREGVYPMWGGYFLRWWFVERALSLVPTNYVTGTSLASLYLRLLGARVGHNVTFETLHFDCADLIDIGDDVVVETLSWIRASRVAHGVLTLRPIVVGKGCSIGLRSGIAGGAVLGEGAILDDLSCAAEGTHIPPGEEWAGSPARRREAPRTSPYDSSRQPSSAQRVRFGIVQTILVACLPLIDMIPFLFTSLLFVRSSGRFETYLEAPLYSVLLILIVCAQILIVKWAVLRRMKPGVYPITGSFVLRKWFADKHFELLAESIVPVYDSLYARAWCRSLGMECGPRAEIAVSARLPYDLIKLGDENFLASDCTVGIPRRHNGEMTLEETRTGKRVFLGNDSVTPQGVVIPDDCLVGAMSRCPDPASIGSGQGQTWLGSPPFRMPMREQSDQFDVEQTYRPSKRLYIERLARETLRIVLPGAFVLPLAALLVVGFVDVWHKISPIAALLSLPLLYAGVSLLAMAIVYLLKRMLVGTYRPTVQPLWSRYVWNTETFSVVLHDFGDPIFGLALQGTLFHTMYLRLLGAKIGKRVFLDTLDVTECDLIRIGDDTAINFNAPLQAHLFEDRVMKTGYIRIGDRCSIGNHSVVLFDTEMKPDSAVGHISLVMKGETIPSGTIWTGSPARSYDIEIDSGALARSAIGSSVRTPLTTMAGD